VLLSVFSVLSVLSVLSADDSWYLNLDGSMSVCLCFVECECVECC